MTDSRPRYLMLDACRGLAAAVVVMQHTRDLFGPTPVHLTYPTVDLFFVLSGFVIAASYGRRLQAGLGFRQFMAIRLTRLYPLFLLGITLGLAAALLDMALRPDSLWSASTLGLSATCTAMALPCPLQPRRGDFVHLFPLDPPAWSLMLELGINILYALLFPRLGGRLLTWLIVTGASWLVATGIAAGEIGGGADWFNAVEGLPRVMFAFFAGVATHRLLPHARKLSTSLPPTLLPWLVPGLIIGSNWLAPTGTGHWLPGIFMVVIYFPGLVLLAACTKPPGRLAALCAWLGTVSYALYIIHYPVYRVVRLLWPATDAERALHAPWPGLALLGGLLLACHWVDRFYDQPLRRWLTARLVTSTGVR